MLSKSRSKAEQNLTVQNAQIMIYFEKNFICFGAKFNWYKIWKTVVTELELSLKIEAYKKSK